MAAFECKGQPTVDQLTATPAADAGDEVARWYLRLGRRIRGRSIALAALVVAGLVALLSTGIMLWPGGVPVLRRQAANAVARQGQPAPAFMLALLDGGTFRLTEQRGRPVVLNFWASWCGPCREEMPAFERTFRAYRDRGVVFVGVAVRDDPAAARALLRELAITYPTGMDDGNSLARQYGLIGMPTTVFITRDGIVARKHTGALNQHQLVGFIEEIVQ